jgi:hypothetical protein
MRAFLVIILRKLVQGLGLCAGLSLLTLMSVTCVDVILRKLGHPLPGAYDIVKMAAGVAIACALPYRSEAKLHTGKFSRA